MVHAEVAGEASGRVCAHETKTINVCVCGCVSKHAKKAVADHYSSVEGQVKDGEGREKGACLFGHFSIF